MPKTLNKTRAMLLPRGGVEEILVYTTVSLYPPDKLINNDHTAFRNDR